MFCCGNFANGKCSFASRGSNDPFTGPANGKIIYNRENGSTGPNVTSTLSGSTSTVTKTVTSLTTATAAAANGDFAPCPADRTTAVGVGVGASLGALLIALATLLFLQIRKRRDLEQRLSAASISPPPAPLAGSVKGGRPANWPVGYKSELPAERAEGTRSAEYKGHTFYGPESAEMRG